MKWYQVYTQVTLCQLNVKGALCTHTQPEFQGTPWDSVRTHGPDVSRLLQAGRRFGTMKIQTYSHFTLTVTTVS